MCDKVVCMKDACDKIMCVKDYVRPSCVCVCESCVRDRVSKPTRPK